MTNKDRSAPLLAILAGMAVGLIVAVPVIASVFKDLYSALEQLAPCIFALGIGIVVLFVFFSFIRHSSKAVELYYHNKPITDERKEEEEIKVPEPPRFRDNSVAGAKILFMDENGCYVSPMRDDKWVNDHMNSNGRKGVCAYNLNDKHTRKQLHKMAELVMAMGHTPLLASISMYGGEVQLTDEGEIISPEADIVSVTEYYG